MYILPLRYFKNILYLLRIYYNNNLIKNTTAMMKFRVLPEFKDLINSEGPILSLVDLIDEEESINERLYIKGVILNGKGQIYAKVNDFALRLFFQGRLSVKDLFLLRRDEEYIIELNGNQTVVFCNGEFIDKVINTIECGDYHYYDIDKNMRLEYPFEEIMRIIDRNYIYGVISLYAGTTFDYSWVQKNIDIDILDEKNWDEMEADPNEK